MMERHLQLVSGPSLEHAFAQQCRRVVLYAPREWDAAVIGLSSPLHLNMEVWDSRPVDLVYRSRRPSE